MKTLTVLCVLLFVHYAVSQTCSFTDNSNPCVVGCNCFKFVLVNSTIASDGSSTTFRWNLTNTCKWAVSYVAFGTAGLNVITPTDGSTYTSESSGMRYTITYTNLAGNPGFTSIKFTPPSGNAFAYGFSDVFVYTVEGIVAATYEYTTVQAHAAQVWETFNVDYSKCVSKCPAGFGGPTCTACDTAPLAGYTWWCEPSGATLQPWVLVLEKCTGPADCPSNGFAPSTGTDPSGYTVTCDCQREYHDCPNNCFGVATCDKTDGTCNCPQGTNPPDCSVTPSTTTGAVGTGSSSTTGSASSGSSSSGSVSTTGSFLPCQEFNFCSSNGLCQNSVCVCSPGWTGANCDVHPPITCQDNLDCHTCGQSTLNCTWCVGTGGAPSCVPTDTCQVGHKVPSCDEGYIEYNPEPCPDACSGNGKCTGKTCVCNDGWTGINCSEEGLTYGQKVAVGVSAAVVAGAIVAAIVGAAVLGGGGYAAHKYLKMQGNINNAQSNPLYEGSTNNRDNPLYENEQNDANKA